MHSVRVPFVYRGMLLFRIADGNQIERNQLFRDVEDSLDGADSFGMRIDAGPDPAETYGMGSEKDIFGCGRKVLLPKHVINS